MKLKAVLLFLLVWLSGSVSGMPPKPLSGKVVYDFSDDWQVYNSRYGSYVPYFNVSNSADNTVSLPVQASAYRGYHLVFSTSQKLYLYINARLSGVFEKDQVPDFNIDSLRQITGKEQFFFTFYNPDGQIELPQAFVVYKTPVSGQVKSNSLPSALNMNRLTGSVFQDFVVLAIVLILLGFAFLRTVYPKDFFQYYNVGYLLNSKNTVSRSLNRMQLFFLINHSLALALGWMIWQQWLSSSIFSSTPQYPLLFEQFFLYAGIFLLLMLCKYLMLFVLAFLLRTEKYAPVHFYLHVSSSMLFYTALVLVLVMRHFQHPEGGAEIAVILFKIAIGFQVLRMGWLAYRLNKLEPFRNVYLFSYFCATELLPAMLGFRFLSQTLI